MQNHPSRIIHPKVVYQDTRSHKFQDYLLRVIHQELSIEIMISIETVLWPLQLLWPDYGHQSCYGYQDFIIAITTFMAIKIVIATKNGS